MHWKWKKKNLAFIQPTKRITTKSRTSTNSWVISVIISIKKCILNRSELSFLSETIKTKYYNEGNISPSMAITVNYFITVCIRHKNLYYKGRVQLLSLYFKNRRPKCRTMSVLIDETMYWRLKAKEIIIANMAEPPGLQN
jgi:hypothetical protein